MYPCFRVILPDIVFTRGSSDRLKATRGTGGSAVNPERVKLCVQCVVRLIKEGYSERTRRTGKRTLPTKKTGLQLANKQLANSCLYTHLADNEQHEFRDTVCVRQPEDSPKCTPFFTLVYTSS